jgi:small-conductance mechanosensitive channel
MYIIVVITMRKKGEKIEYGEKMIKVSIRFWTDGLPKSANRKTAWAKGVVYLNYNKARAIGPDHLMFNDSTELLQKIQELLKRNDVKLVMPSEKVSEVSLG